MLNPILFTERVVSDFLKYQLTAYPFADHSLYAQMRSLLNLDETRNSPLLKGPFVGLSKTFEEGAAVADLANQDVFHPHLQRLVDFPNLYGHQEQGVRAIHEGKHTLVSTGTGSGKTETFLYPIISRCLKLRDEGAPAGVVAVIVYPMNALADDQLERLRGLLAGSGIPFGRYTGATPDSAENAHGVRLDPGASRADYEAELERQKVSDTPLPVLPPEERVSREQMQEPGGQPRILLTNVKQLEYLLTRQRDIRIFYDAPLEFVVFDEIHTFTGAQGAETACLVRRLRSFCGKKTDETVCIGTSATIVDPDEDDSAQAGRDFVARFFGVDGDNVELVGERYQPDVWADPADLSVPAPLSGDVGEHLKNVLRVIEKEDAGPAIAPLFTGMTGLPLDETRWRQDLYGHLSRNELLYQLVELLDEPKAISELPDLLEPHVGRRVDEPEILLWLALGSASRSGDRPLTRPVIHSFVRGMEGARVTFPMGSNEPKLWLDAESIEDDPEAGAPLKALRVMTCSTCGQHYFEHWAKDFTFKNRSEGLQGGEAHGNGTVWPAEEEVSGGKRLVLIDHLISDEDPSRRSAEIYFCRLCGCLSNTRQSHCAGCGTDRDPIKLLVCETSERHPGRLGSCLCCRSSGGTPAGRYYEPARPVRATTVSDVHVIAQNMLQHSERPRLLVFSDNRQEAAFQAGWMRDHARRYRIRAMIYARVKQGAASVGDIVHYLNETLDADDALSRAIIPEVWKVARKDAGRVHDQERRYFLRILALREITTSQKQRVGLEPWGRITVTYSGLDAESPFVKKWADALSITQEEMKEGIAGILDHERRNNIAVYDPEREVFTRWWSEGDREVMDNYLPLLPNVPAGLVLARNPQHSQGRVKHWLNQQGSTSAMLNCKAWGLDNDDCRDFLKELWDYLTEIDLLRGVIIRGGRGNAARGFEGAHQIDADKLVIESSRGVHRCKVCRRGHSRPTPKNLCMAYRCSGEVIFEEEDPDDYDLQVLDENYELIQPQEHTAQIPAEDRAKAERQFKSPGGATNTLVCTPTLEMGVDIGALDSVLMRNVPPKPSNYFQRAGRAGRRHRMAVNVTYARAVSHDRAYFTEPMKMLGGSIYPPRFNLKNQVLVSKHVHAATITLLFDMRERGNLSDSDRSEIGDVLAECIPPRISSYLFNEAGEVRTTPLSVDPLAPLISKHREHLLDTLIGIFSDGWPEADAEATSVNNLGCYLDDMTHALTEVIQRIWRRLQWALSQMRRLDDSRRVQGTLTSEDDAFYRRCDQLVKRLKGEQSRARSESEGMDDVYTYAVLAMEGFLPGYGLDRGSILGTALASRIGTGKKDFVLGRPLPSALREFVPGNLTYAHGDRYVARRFHLGAEDPVTFYVNLDNESVRPLDGAAAPGALGGDNLRAVPICDVDMPHYGGISDLELFRFQMPVTTVGYEQQRHSGGAGFRCGSHNVIYRSGLHLRMVNIGPRDRVNERLLGYPVCLVSGNSRSPYASQAELDNFRENQVKYCGQPPEEHLGFYADAVCDSLKLQELPSRNHAYTAGECLRIAATAILEMELDDIQLLVTTEPSRTTYDLILFDPMPGGSGLLEEMVEHWTEIHAHALDVARNCPSSCESSCIDCLQNYRNSFYHRYLNRDEGAEVLEAMEPQLTERYPIPPEGAATAAQGGEIPANVRERQLLALILAAGLPEPIAQKEIMVSTEIGKTFPDFFYEDPDDPTEPGLCIYMDGLSDHIHGNPQTRQRDVEIREALRRKDYEVVEIPATHIDDKDDLARHFLKVGRYLFDRETARGIRERRGEWFDVGHQEVNVEGHSAAEAGDGASTSEFDSISDIWPEGEEFEVTYPYENLGNILPAGTVGRFKRVSESDDVPAKGTVVVVRHDDLGVAAGKLHWKRHRDVGAEEPHFVVTLRSLKPGIPHKEVRLSVDEWESFRPLAMLLNA